MLDLWPKGTRRSRFEQAAEEVRFQLGQSDRFREGIVRSGAWREHIADDVQEDGPAARARGAAARRVLVQHVRLFEGRRRRHVAVHARHRPALPAHRCGRRRAARSVSLDRGGRALPGAELHRARQLAAGADGVQPRSRRHAPRAGAARHQRHRRPSCASTTAASFGFASRNFYVAFLAALEIDSDPEKFFGPIRRNPIDTSLVLTVPDVRAGEPHRHRARAGPRRAAPSESVAAAVGVERLAPRAARLRAARADARSICSRRWTSQLRRRALRRAGRRDAASRPQRRDACRRSRRAMA